MIPNSYRIPGTALAGGEYPGSLNDDDASQKISALLGAGVRTFLDLTSAHDRMRPYDGVLAEEAAALGVPARRVTMPIGDMDVTDPAHMNEILDLIDREAAEGRVVYVHCWGGVGRTGTVVGCHLVRHGASGEEALRTVRALFATMSPEKVAAHGGESPQTDAQREMVRDWARRDRLRTSTPPGAPVA